MLSDCNHPVEHSVVIIAPITKAVAFVIVAVPSLSSDMHIVAILAVSQVVM